MRDIRASEEAWTGRDGVPELALWRAVIEMALRDALGNGGSYGGCNVEYVRRRARDWFIDGTRDFRMVCSLAGLDPEAVRHSARRKMREAGNARA